MDMTRKMLLQIRFTWREAHDDSSIPVGLLGGLLVWSEAKGIAEGERTEYFLRLRGYALNHDSAGYLIKKVGEDLKHSAG
jgi:hypothetical protein